MCGASITSIPPITWTPENDTFVQPGPGSLRITERKRLESLHRDDDEPAAVTLSRDHPNIAPYLSGDVTGPAASLAQFAGSKVSPSGSFRTDSSSESITLSPMSVTLKLDPKRDFRSVILAMLPFDEG